VGALIWRWIEQEQSDWQIAANLSNLYGFERDESIRASTLFIETLLSKGLICPHQPTQAFAGVLSTSVAPVIATPATYSVPVLEEYTDMSDLLLLDPIHDVNELGWPVKRDDLK
jgi:hypothetical protein